jgi:protein-S-isoprenylcysteine O-methyltransferase Ste14
MKISEWGFTRQGWRNGERGEYLVLLQGILLIGFILLPVYRPVELNSAWASQLYLRWGVATVFGLMGLALIFTGLFDLGGNLTPLPYPKDNGQLIQSGAYSLVRHPLYSGIIFVAFGWVVFQFSLSHLIATAVLFAFFNTKASREEAWLTQKYPEYSDYQQRVKRLIPGVY